MDGGMLRKWIDAVSRTTLGTVCTAVGVAGWTVPTGADTIIPVSGLTLWSEAPTLVTAPGCGAGTRQLAAISG